MAESDLYSTQECLEYLLEDDGWWLWSIYVYREKFRLLSSVWPKLKDEDARKKCREAKVKHHDDNANVDCSKLKDDDARKKCREAKVKN